MLAVPQKFRVATEGQATRNQTFESLSLSPNNRSLFTAVEGTLWTERRRRAETISASCATRDCGPDVSEPAEEFFYLTGPGQNVVEIVARSRSELLVLEHGIVEGPGETPPGSSGSL